MHSATRIPASVSVYEALRTRPAATHRLAAMGITRDLYDHPIAEAARVIGVPAERLTAELSAAQPVARIRNA